jgi:hypothetical protein
MVVMSIAESWPRAGQPFTIAELDRMPDDGRRYELLDGVLIVSPRPVVLHQEVVSGSASFPAVRPFEVDISPAQLVAGLWPPDQPAR